MGLNPGGAAATTKYKRPCQDQGRQGKEGMHLMKRITSVLASLAIVAAAATATLGSGPALAQDKGEVYFLSWGGTVQTMLEKEGWADTFKEDTGCTVTLVPKAAIWSSLALNI